ncbi:DUF429 domain-containing protein [Aureimonas mangrovi]|uniref:DUF429 domain-containing protein n=1 Tax=Aureimonas mangrovi TaxID=2758041 RepID=UPI00163DDAEE|nr:DUF429 domain-containing protein [Aureimonas mangrovi]
MTAERTLAGVDGCRAGWLAAIEHPGKAPSIAVFTRFADLLAALPDDALIAVDMPIGLPERIDGPGRAAEKAARPHLAMRQSSVFSIPARAAVELWPGLFHDELHRRESHAAASALARTLSDPPRGVSIQGYMLFGKILEIDALLRESPALTERVIESHPEMAFRAMNGGVPAMRPKKVKNRPNPDGLDEREALLAVAGISRAAFAHVPPGTGRDDLLDALAMLVTARRHAQGLAVSYPDPPDRDAHGLPIAIRA